jgi:hypothetical protein
LVGVRVGEDEHWWVCEDTTRGVLSPSKGRHVCSFVLAGTHDVQAKLKGEAEEPELLLDVVPLLVVPGPGRVVKEEGKGGGERRRGKEEAAARARGQDSFPVTQRMQLRETSAIVRTESAR